MPAPAAEAPLGGEVAGLIGRGKRNVEEKHAMESLDTLVSAGAAVVGAAVGTAAALLIGFATLRRQYRLEHQAEALVRRFLKHKRWRLRTFQTIKYHIAGFEDNELRQILIRAGALCFQDDEGVEVWGLMERTHDLIESEYGTNQN
jgi:hypothetical protein